MMVETIALLSYCRLTVLDFLALIGKKCSPVYFTQYSMTSGSETEHTGKYDVFVVSRGPIHDCKFQFLLASGQSFAFNSQACPAYLACFLPS